MTYKQMRLPEGKKIPAGLSRFLAGPVLFFSLIVWLEIVFRVKVFGSIFNIGTIYAIVFAIPVSIFMFLISSLFSVKTNRVAAAILVFICTLIYAVQTVYHGIFRAFLSVYSLSGTGQVMQFWPIILWGIWHSLIALLFLFLPFVLFLIFGIKRLNFSRITRIKILSVAGVMAAAHLFTLIIMLLPGKNAYTPYNLYYEVYVPELSVQRLGLLTAIRLDIKHLLTGFDNNLPDIVEKPTTDSSGTTDKKETLTPEKKDPVYHYNIIDIDFNKLIENEKDSTLIDMHNYFSKVKPTLQNEYTGLFKGCNLILITAESFSHYLLDKDLMPTLYKLANEGFVFNNFYNPIWGVSTSDGEYVACTGLIPKSGVWSLYRTGEQKNWLPFVMGNQFRGLGYSTMAYHNHTYSYYKRNISHPNMGYTYKGLGNGLDVKKTWPESDLEMMDLSTPEYVNEDNFHVYYMTVSGHMNYSFSANYMAYKNRKYVEDLPYSDNVKAYLACNIELDRGLKLLLERLEKSGAADNTVIALSADHYPYGLPLSAINELAGHEVEKNFEIYKSAFILWKKGMDSVTVDKPCSSLDIIPTLSNLFGLEYDSRLLMGQDIFSNADPLVLFSNRSWITDKARYNSYTNTMEELSSLPVEDGYKNEINDIVSGKFKYSAKILEKDYYRIVLPPKNDN